MLPNAKEIIDNCGMGNAEFSQWYNFRIKVLRGDYPGYIYPASKLE